MMKINSHASHLITNLLGLAFIIKAISVLLNQDMLHSQIENPGLHFGTYVSYIGNLLFFISGILGLIFEGMLYPRYVKVLFGLILSWIFIVYIRSGGSMFDPSQFMGVKGIGPYLGMGVLFSASPIRFKKMTKIFLYVGLILVVGGIFNTIKLGVGFDRFTAQMQLRLISVNLVWISPLILFYNYKKHKVLSIAIFGFSFIFSLLIVTRSFILLHLLVLLFFMRFVLKKSIGSLLLISIAAIVALFLLPSIGVLEQAVNLLSERGNEDSRSSQILQFFADVNFNDFIWGAGVSSTWNWDSREYEWLDNQVLLTAWWAGILAVICYLSLIIKPTFTVLFGNEKYLHKKLNAFLLFLWIMALLGFAIYVSISTSLYHFTICFLLGTLLIKKNYAIKNEIKQIG